MARPKHLAPRDPLCLIVPLLFLLLTADIVSWFFGFPVWPKVFGITLIGPERVIYYWFGMAYGTWWVTFSKEFAHHR